MNSLFFFIVILSVVVSENSDSYSLRSFESQQDDFQCSKDGYLQYLNKWTLEEKSSSRDPTSPDFSHRLEYFIDSCMKIHEWNRREKYPMEFTYYADWSSDEFEAVVSQ